MPDSLSAWLATLERRHYRPIDLGLERCSRVWRALAEPRPAAGVITVAGTNGKGSAVAYIAAILGSAGARVGTYTSPHLLRFNERLRLPDGEASDAALVNAFERVESVRGETSLSYFEFTTLAAFLLMHEADLDWAVLEVGLGGRLDTVNLVDPDLAVIMPIGLDHQQYLGPDRESIGAEKAGILRAETPVVCGDRDPPQAVLNVARALEAPLLRLGRDFDFYAEGGRCLFRCAGRTLAFPDPPMRGAHQWDNLATALAAVAVAAPQLLDDGRGWRTALEATQLPGRLSRHAGDDRIILDVGHNPLAAEVVAAELASRRGGKVHCVLGMLRDKDAESVARVLAGQVDRWYFAGLQGDRGQSGAALQRRVRSVLPEPEAEAYADVAAALEAARDCAAAEDLILVFGSFGTAAAALRALSARTAGTAH